MIKLTFIARIIQDILLVKKILKNKDLRRYQREGEKERDYILLGVKEILYKSF